MHLYVLVRDSPQFHHVVLGVGERPSGHLLEVQLIGGVTNAPSIHLLWIIIIKWAIPLINFSLKPPLKLNTSLFITVQWIRQFVVSHFRFFKCLRIRHFSWKADNWWCLRGFRARVINPKVQVVIYKLSSDQFFILGFASILYFDTRISLNQQFFELILVITV